MKSFDNISEKELLLRLHKGDEAAFSALYEGYYRQLYRYAYSRLRNREVAKDVVHDLFANLWDKRAVLHIDERLSSYLYKATRNRMLDFISKEQSRSGYLASLSDFLDKNANDTDYLVREKMLTMRIEEEIKQLSPQVRSAFDLSRKANLSHKEIADKLGVSESTVRGYIKTALKRLRLKFGMWIHVAVYLLFRLF